MAITKEQREARKGRLGSSDMASVKPVEYRPIEGYPGYRVGNDGSVWSCWRPAGAIIGWRISEHWRMLKSWVNTEGRNSVILSRNGITKHFNISTLVLSTFLGCRPAGMECCHENGNRRDDRASNLRWGTHSSNILDKKRHGTDRYFTKITDEQVKKIRMSRFEDVKKIAIEFGIHPEYARRVYLHLARKGVS